MSSDSRWELTTEAAASMLRAGGLVNSEVDISVESLGGGVSNTVLQAQWDSGCAVLKQPLPNLAVEDEWPADVTRVHNEAAAARVYYDVIVASEIDAAVPRVLLEDKEKHVIAIECAPPDAVMWKRELLEGIVDSAVASLLGELLGAVQVATTGDSTVRQKFAENRPFDQLRLDPYHRTTAERHPDVAEEILVEVDRISGIEETLVHGDYSPKNVLVDPDRVHPPWILDFEVAHWGDPAFDAAFMLNHLLIKSIFKHRRAHAYHDAARAFWTAYNGTVPWDVESEVVAELGVLLLARMDGKSPVEYVEDGAVAARIRRIAKQTIRSELNSVAGLLELAVMEIDTL